MRDRPVTLDELRAIVLPLAAHIGDLRAEVADLRAALAAKLTDDQPPKEGPHGSKPKR